MHQPFKYSIFRSIPVNENRPKSAAASARSFARQGFHAAPPAGGGRPPLHRARVRTLVSLSTCERRGALGLHRRAGAADCSTLGQDSPRGRRFETLLKG